MMRVTKIGKQTGFQLCAKDERDWTMCMYIYSGLDYTRICPR